MTQHSWHRTTVTEEEILSQPQCWRTCLDQLRNDGTVREICSQVPEDALWLFIGCGTSYYLALAAAAAFSTVTGRAARAVPASEILLFPHLVLHRRRALVPVLISRSGRTTEMVQAAEFLERARGIRTISITCSPNQALGRATHLSLVLPPATEQSTVMTRSFTSMLLGLQFLAGTIAARADFLAALQRTPDALAGVLDSMVASVRDFVEAHDFDDYAFLGQGPFYGLACEAALKVMESSCSYSQSFHSLEFRHGPKSVVSPRTLTGFFISESGRSAEIDLLEEIKSLGGTTLTVTNRADARLRLASDLLIEVPSEDQECSRLITCLPALQLLGVYTGLKKGLDPDSPRNLSQVVVLDKAR
jgi:glucosamine--fructose-6-phosphate aminotransferase (isomerizing)